MKMPTRDQVESFMRSLPGKRGIDIPEDVFDRIHSVANGITKQIWGTAPTPHQLDQLYRTGAHTPDKIHAAYSALPHPHAPSVTVGEYQQYSQALDLYNQHQDKYRGQ